MKNLQSQSSGDFLPQSFQVDLPAKINGHEAKVVNLSIGGCRLDTDCQFKEGQIVQVEIKTQDNVLCFGGRVTQSDHRRFEIWTIDVSID